MKTRRVILQPPLTPIDVRLVLRTYFATPEMATRTLQIADQPGRNYLAGLFSNSPNKDFLVDPHSGQTTVNDAVGGFITGNYLYERVSSGRGFLSSSIEALINLLGRVPWSPPLDTDLLRKFIGEQKSPINIVSEFLSLQIIFQLRRSNWVNKRVQARAAQLILLSGKMPALDKSQMLGPGDIAQRLNFYGELIDALGRKPTKEDIEAELEARTWFYRPDIEACPQPVSFEYIVFPFQGGLKELSEEYEMRASGFLVQRTEVTEKNHPLLYFEKLLHQTRVYVNNLVRVRGKTSQELKAIYELSSFEASLLEDIVVRRMPPGKFIKVYRAQLVDVRKGLRKLMNIFNSRREDRISTRFGKISRITRFTETESLIHARKFIQDVLIPTWGERAKTGKTIDLYRVIDCMAEDLALDDQHKDIFFRRYIGKEELADIGNIYGLSSEVVSSLLDNIVQRAIKFQNSKLIEKESRSSPERLFDLDVRCLDTGPFLVTLPSSLEPVIFIQGEQSKKAFKRFLDRSGNLDGNFETIGDFLSMDLVKQREVLNLSKQEVLQLLWIQQLARLHLGYPLERATEVIAQTLYQNGIYKNPLFSPRSFEITNKDGLALALGLWGNSRDIANLRLDRALLLISIYSQGIMQKSWSSWDGFKTAIWERLGGESWLEEGWHQELFGAPANQGQPTSLENLSRVNTILGVAGILTQDRET